MRQTVAAIGIACCLLTALTEEVFGSASSMRRALRRMVGYTVVASDSVSDVVERRGEKYVELLSGGSFKVEGLILDPLVATDVVVFGKRVADSLRRQYPNLEERHYYSYKLLIDDDFYDATAY